MKKLLLASLLASASSWAQSPAQSATPAASTSTASSTEQAPTEVRYRARTVIEIGPADIQGSVKGPTAEIYIAKKKPGFRNLIELRSNFRPELAVSGSHL